MAQFDVYLNPVAPGRRAYPFVVALRSDLAADLRDEIVAPLALRATIPGGAGRVTPVVEIDGDAYIILVPKMTVIPSRDLVRRHVAIPAARADILAAIDYLFFGI